MEKTYHVEGMACAGCQKTIEKKVSGLTGVIDVTTDLADKTLTVRGTFTDEAIKAGLAHTPYRLK